MLRYDSFLSAEVGSSPPPVVFDPYWEFVKILLFGEGLDGGTTFTDHSSIGRDLTANGNVQQDTDISVMGQSILFDGSGDFITAPDADDLSVETSIDFCIEAYIRPTNISGLKTISNKRLGTSAQEHSFFLSTGNVALSTFGSGSSRLGLVGSTTLAINTIYHVAASRQGATARVFVNGELDGTDTQSGAVTTNSSPFRIGRDGFNTGRDFAGNMNWFRFTLGHARYTENFTPPTVPFPMIGPS